MYFESFFRGTFLAIQTKTKHWQCMIGYGTFISKGYISCGIWVAVYDKSSYQYKSLLMEPFLKVSPYRIDETVLFTRGKTSNLLSLIEI